MRWTRVIIYAALIILAVLFLVPLGVVVVNSLRSSQEIAATSLIGLAEPSGLHQLRPGLEQILHGRALLGIEPYMLNSLTLAIPATIISHAAWRARRLFDLALALSRRPVRVRCRDAWHLPARTDEADPLGVVLRDLSLMNTIAGLVLIHTVQGMSFTTAVLPQLLYRIPQDLLKAARIDGAGFSRIFWRIILPLSPPILIVTVIFQFTGI